MINSILYYCCNEIKTEMRRILFRIGECQSLALICRKHTVIKLVSWLKIFDITFVRIKHGKKTYWKFLLS